MQIDDSVTIVTGAGSGIGRSLAEAFAAAGAPVVVGDINADGAEETRERIRASGGRAVALCADASSIAGIEELIGRAEDDFGPVDIFVANAGVIGPAGLGSEPDWDVTLDVNLRAHIRAARLLAPGWVQRGGGHFVSVASAAGLLRRSALPPTR